MRRRLATVFSLSLVAVTLLASGRAFASNASAAEPRLVDLINRERAPRGLQSVRYAADLRDIAWRQAKRMAEQGRIYHNPNLATEVQHYLVIGENVGVGTDADGIHSAFMASSVHRAEILEPRYSEVGVGVFDDGQYLWVSEVFRQPDGTAPADAAPAQAAPAPAPSASTPAPAAAPAPATPVRATPAAPRPTRLASPSAPSPAPVAPAPVATPAPPARAPMVFGALQVAQESAMVGMPTHGHAATPATSRPKRPLPAPAHTAPAAILIVGWFALWRRLRPTRS